MNSRQVHQSRALQFTFSVAAVLACLYAGVCLYMWHAQRQLVFVPEAVVDRSPARIGLQFTDVEIAVDQRSAVAAWWMPGEAADAQSAVVLYLHGNDGNLAHELERLQVLHSYGLPILAIDYRGYGRSSGPFPSEARVYDDAVAAWSYLVEAKHIEPRRIVIYGHSLGAAVAAELALRKRAACGVVMESGFTSMADVARLHYPWIPVDLLLNQTFDVMSKIDRLETTVMLVHGSADLEVPAVMSERLYHAAHDPKRLILVNGAGHEDAITKAGDVLQGAIAGLARGCSA